ncbi:hypothetical protein HI914_06018 [Erysiphe necator]|nr:hypothetical protein HI914_06018 [Erysiphe necator]
MTRDNLSTGKSKLPRAKQSHHQSTACVVNESKTTTLSTQTLKIDGEEIPLLEISNQGDVILDLLFQNSSDCTRSIVPKDGSANSNKSKNQIGNLKIIAPHVRICYRVKLETLTKSSSYFRLLFSTQFAEGIATQNTIQILREESSNDQKDKEKNKNQLDDNYLSKIPDVVKKLARTKIIDEDLATKTLGREFIFGDILRVIHGLEPIHTPYTTLSWTILVLLADNYDVVPCISCYFQKACLSHINRINSNKNEEVLRQKILIQYHMEKGPRFTLSTKDLIMRGSTFIETTKTSSKNMKGVWWDLPYGIESEIAYRRACVLRTIASIQTQFLNLYSSRELQCKLGYVSSNNCDSFQLGEMVKFLTKKELLFLISFQPTLFDDDSESCSWPKAYTGDIDTLIGKLRQCPSYKLDEYHSHCGLRSRLIPALDYIMSCLSVGLGIRLIHKKGSYMSQPHFISWRSSSTSADREYRPVWTKADKGKVVDCAESDEKKESLVFQFALAARNKLLWSLGEKEVRDLFTAKSWNWITEQDVDSERLGISFGVMK